MTCPVQMTTALFMLRCVQIGLSIRDLDLLTIGMVNEMFLFDIEAFVTNIYLTNESNHFVKDTAAFIEFHFFIDFFFADYATSMYAEVVQVEI